MIVVDSNDIQAVASPTGDPIILGRVFLKMLMDPDSTGGMAISSVTFTPGSRNKFHVHDNEQILYVTEGKGIVATKEKEYVVTPGTVVFIPAGEVHWHGAVEDSPFTHIALFKGQCILAE